MSQDIKWNMILMYFSIMKLYSNREQLLFQDRHNNILNCSPESPIFRNINKEVFVLNHMHMIMAIKDIDMVIKDMDMDKEIDMIIKDLDIAIKYLDTAIKDMDILQITDIDINIKEI